jgi:hypothetical protein
VLEGFGGRAANADKFKAYAFALEGLPVESIARGVRKILRGEAGLDPNFPPTAPQLAKACKPVTFLSPGWIPLENTREPEQIEKPRSHLSGIVGGALKKFPTEEEDK